MPYLYVDDEQWRPKAREADGWVRIHKDKGIYDQTGVDIDFRLPYFEEEPWIGVARQFDIALELIRPTPGMRVLDVGAGRGWAAKHLAVRGCRAVAVDVTADDQIGLGRSRALMDEAGVLFDALVADSERLPFADASFDVVFCAAALHHTTDLAALMANIARVLRRGGRLVAINEPCIADEADDEEVRRTHIAEELAYGINETRPRLDDYRRVLSAAGLRETSLFTWQSHGMSRAALAAWSRGLGVPEPSTFLRFSVERRNRGQTRCFAVVAVGSFSPRPRIALAERRPPRVRDPEKSGKSLLRWPPWQPSRLGHRSRRPSLAWRTTAAS